MNPIYSTTNILRSDNATETPEEQYQRKTLRRHAVLPKHPSGSTRLAERQLDAFLHNSQKPDSLPAQRDIGTSKQVASLPVPVPAPILKRHPSENQEVEVFYDQPEESFKASVCDTERGAIQSSGRHSALSENAAHSEYADLCSRHADIPALPMTSELEKLRDALDKDISSFSTEDLVNYLEHIRSTVGTKNMIQNHSDCISEEPSFDTNLFKEALTALDFMQGYSDAQSRQLHERQRIDNAFLALREQLILQYAPITVPSSTSAMSHILEFTSSYRAPASSEKKLAGFVGLKRDKDSVTSPTDEDIELSIVESVQLAKQIVLENSDAASRAHDRRQEREKQDSTLPLIIQRSA